MSQEVSKQGYNPNISHLWVGYNPFTNHLLTSWDIQVNIRLPETNSSKLPRKPGPQKNVKDRIPSILSLGAVC